MPDVRNRRRANSLALNAVSAAGIAVAVLASAPSIAAIIGFHDSSDSVKTIGWACSTANADPVKVHLYVNIDGMLKRLDSQLADKRRDDLGSTCTGVGHAFRFSDYAATADGVALYSSAGAVALHVYAETPEGLQRLTGSPRLVSFAPVGLWDPGLTNGRWRTDLNNRVEGTAQAPLLLGDCVFTTPFSDGYAAFSGGGDDPTTHCRYGSIINPVSNAATSEASGWPQDSFWVITANVEPALDNPRCANGPPGQSRRITPPGTGSLFGVAALPDGEASHPERKKFHLVLNSWNTNECRSSSYGIPYLAFGAQADRGNNGPITYLNRPGMKTVLKFGMTLMDIAERNPAFATTQQVLQRYRQSHLLIEAIWYGKKRWLFVEMLPDARRSDGVVDAGIDAHIRFNWHMVDSFIYPGADYVYKSAAVLSAQCAQERVFVTPPSPSNTYLDPATRVNSRVEHSIDLQKTFDCLDRLATWGVEPMPTHPIPITGIHFGIEMDDRLYRDGSFTGEAAPNALWIALDDIRLETSPMVAKIAGPLPMDSMEPVPRLRDGARGGRRRQ